MWEWTDQDFTGGHRALDFINTIDDDEMTRDITRLVDWQAFVDWSERSGFATPAELQMPQSQAIQVLQRLHDLREPCYDFLQHLATTGAVNEGKLARVQEFLKAALDRAALRPTGAGFVWSPIASSDAADPGQKILDRMALEVLDLLQSPSLERLKQCDRCTWLFLNTGRGKGRRWCKMEVCGNRTKVEAFRRKSALAATA